MATTTKIEWADKTWSPIIGCDRVSDGCLGCYAIPQARIRSANPNPKVAEAFAGTVHDTGERIDWTGQVNILDERLTQPMQWRKPLRIFVNSLSDMFHKNVPTEFIQQVFAVMALTPRHTYQMLTKRHARMRALLNDPVFRLGVLVWTARLQDDKHPMPPWNPGDRTLKTWPLPNLHLGVSVEDQQWADIRIPALLATPAAVRWISAEPLLGPVDLGIDDPHRDHDSDDVHGVPHPRVCLTCSTNDREIAYFRREPGGNGIDWVVVGGETGHRARPTHPDWFRSLRDQCTAAGIPFFFKQFGDWGLEAPLDANGSILSGKRGMGMVLANDGTLYDPGDLSYPDGPRRGEALRAGHDKAHLTAVYRVGKKKAGRELDGREHNDFPAVSS